MTESNVETGEAVAVVDADQVCDFLQQNPEFFRNQPQLLELIEVPHTGGGTSLLEHQASLLRDKNRVLKGQLRQYREIASDNEQRLQKLHDLHLDMLHAANLNSFLDDVFARLCNDFECDQAVLLLFGSTSATHDRLKLAGKKAELFDDVRRRKESVCGRLRAEKLTLLFGDKAGAIQSAALAPLDDQAELGLLALGSIDKEKFHPGMGTLFLDLLGQMLGQAMLPLLAEV